MALASIYFLLVRDAHTPKAHIARQGSSERTTVDRPRATSESQPNTSPVPPAATANAVNVVPRLTLPPSVRMGLQPAPEVFACVACTLSIIGPPLLGVREQAIAHHAAVLVLEVVAVIHEKPGIGRRETHADALA
jgi:hypothetical protein